MLRRALVFLLLLLPAGVAGEKEAGAVLAIGGGTLTDAIVDRLVALASGKRLVVCPAASEKVEGPEADRFRERGAREVVLVDFRSRADADVSSAALAFDGAGAVFFTGGDQKRLLETLRGTRALAALRAAHERGTAVAGTSAGCAVLGELAILGDGEPDRIKAGVTPTGEGLGFCKGVILDQHFLARKRHNRLVSALLEKKSATGIGIDERTGILWRDGTFEVVGESVVSVYRPGKGTEFTLELLAAGERGKVR